MRARSLPRAAICALLALSWLNGCRPADKTVPVQEHVSAARVSLQAFLEQAAGSPARSFMTYDFGRSRDEQAISVIVAEERYLDLVDQLRPSVPRGWLIFAGTDRWLGDEDHGDRVELVIGPGNDQFDALRLARSDAVNYDMMTEDLIRKLKEYDSVVGIEILQANTDTIVARLKSVPPDLVAFAADVYAFCPDIVDQGVGSVDALKTQIRETRLLYLWWD